MDKSTALQNLLHQKTTEEEIQMIRGMLASGEISIGGNVNQSIIILGSGNTVELTPAALNLLNARPMLGNLDRDLTGEEIAAGLRRLDKLLPNRAPILLPDYKDQGRRLRSNLKTESTSLSESARRERLEALATINSICLEAVDISFNSLCLGEEAPKYEARCPFRGLESFRVEDCEFFFGREELTQKLIGKIKAHPFLAVLGASGSGKSSLVMAGMIPALNLDYAIIRPGTKPLDALDSARGKPLLVVDQFEELFTLTRDEKTRADFILALLDLTRKSRVIITLRSDFLGEAGAYRSLSEEIQNHLEIIPPMNADELRRAMEGQARWARLEFEADLSQQILDDVAGEPGAMPLLQHALWELWNRRHGRHLRAKEYRAFGKVMQAITSTAENVYADCSNPEQEQVRDLFLRLTRLDDGNEGRDTRRRVVLSDLIPSDADADSISILLDKLASTRLIVKTVNDDVTEIEVAHEAIIRHWERLRIWLNEDRDHLRLRESVGESAKEWEKSDKHESLLNSRWVKLDEALLLAQDSRYRLTETEQAYLQGCVTLRNREQREREQRLRWTVFASIAAAIIFLVLGSFGLLKSNEATSRANEAATAQANAEVNANNAATAQSISKEQTDIAVARQLAAQAQLINATRNSKQLIADLLAIQSLRMFPSSEASQILINGSYSVRPTFAIKHRSVVFSLDFSPNGNYIVSGSAQDVRVWDLGTGQEVIKTTHDATVVCVAFSPDSQYVASGSIDNTIRIWEVSTGKEVSRMNHDDWVSSVTFSPDGNYLLSGSRDGTARVWDVSTGREIARMRHGDWVQSVAFSPDGNYVVSGGHDNTARVWEAKTGKEISRITDDGFVNSVAFSPDGKYIVSGGWSTARVWEASTGFEIAKMNHESLINSVAFSPDGRYVVSGGYDSIARVWESTTGKEISRLPHDGSINSVVFSPDGKYVISGSYDGTARIWESQTGLEVARITHDDIVTFAAFSRDGKYAAAGSYDNSLQVWEVLITNKQARYENNKSYDVPITNPIVYSPDGKYLSPITNYDSMVHVFDAATGVEFANFRQNGYVTSVVFSADGKYIASGSDDKTACVWELATKQSVSCMPHNEIVNSVSFSPDGKYLATGGEDKIIHIWDPYTGNEIAQMKHEDAVNSVVFSPDGKYVASASDDRTSRVWSVGTWNEISRILHDERVNTAAFNSNSSLVVSASYDKTARVWEVNSGREVSRMVHDSSVISVAFTPDGKFVVSGGNDNNARIWETETGMEITRVNFDSAVVSVAFSEDGRYLTASAWNYFRVVAWQSGDLLVDACSRNPRNLTRAEWDQYIGETIPYQAVCPNLPIEPEP